MRRQLLALAFLSSAAWTWENPRPLGSALADAVEHAGVVHAVGERGAIARSSDDGRTWQVLPSPTVADLAGAAASGTLVFAVGDGGTILRSKAGGAFELRPTAVKHPFIDVAIANDTVYAIARDGSLARSTDAGDTFVALAGVGRRVVPTAIVAAPSGVVLVATSTGLSRSSDHGATFKDVPAIAEPLQALSGSRTIYALGGPRVSYAATEACGSCFSVNYEVVSLYRSTDLGLTWKRRALEDHGAGPTGWGSTATPAPPATPPGKGLYHRVDAPTRMAPWTRRTLMVSGKGEVFASAMGVLFVSIDGVSFGRRTGVPILVTATGTLIDGTTGRSTDRGDNWMARASTTEEDGLFSIAVTPDGRAFGVGMNGTVLARTASGQWTRVTSPTTSRLSQVFALDNDRLVAVGSSGTILVSSDRGRTFAVRSSGTTEHLHAVWGAGRDIIVTGSGDARGQVVLRSSDAGATWKRLPGLGSDAGIGLWGSSIDDLYMVTINGGQLRSVDRGATWTDVGGALDGVIAGVWGNGPNVYLIGWGGRLHYSPDRGKTWRERSVGTKENLRAIWGRGPNDIYIAAGDHHGAGSLFHSTDGGITWRPEKLPLATPIVAIAGDARTVYVAGTGTRIVRN